MVEKDTILHLSPLYMYGLYFQYFKITFLLNKVNQ